MYVLHYQVEMINQSKQSGLKKVLGFPSLFAAAIGLVVAQSCFVSILQGVGNGGATFFIALIIAFLLTLCYSATWAELSLMMPKAGGISTYTLTAIGPLSCDHRDHQWLCHSQHHGITS